MLSIGQCAQAACLLETTARKLGDVGRTHDFDHVEFIDFLLSAVAIGPVLDQARTLGVGKCVLECIRQTRTVTTSNTNLGVVLLLAPLACLNGQGPIEREIEVILTNLTLEESQIVYEAIRLAQPGAMGKVAEQDVANVPTFPLRQIMALAADRDLIARQYANGFREVLQVGVPALTPSHPAEEAILRCQLRLLCDHPDTLIARKHGEAEAEEASARARRVCDLGWPGTEAARSAWHELDQWMRDPQRQRNPGATADLVTASLFLALRTGTMPLPGPRPWAASHLFH